MGEFKGGVSSVEGEIEFGESGELIIRGVGIGGGRKVGKGEEGGGDLLIGKEREKGSKMKEAKMTGCGIVRRDI